MHTGTQTHAFTRLRIVIQSHTSTYARKDFSSRSVCRWLWDRGLMVFSMIHPHQGSNMQMTHIVFLLYMFQSLSLSLFPALLLSKPWIEMSCLLFLPCLRHLSLILSLCLHLYLYVVSLSLYLFLFYLPLASPSSSPSDSPHIFYFPISFFLWVSPSPPPSF